ncbi:putative type IX secretion system sortase PorU2 [Arcicella lustrica]|uniref:C25 family cysteine peptidase n=1 Tax=Arcicella lustrica TaxID=2984196 RepID=A0ABU5SD31_9BACT|nr:C25 family cysteine peptidase [Arcicella sp. DC25W]MEA5425182.1 C25 family cysteine peptidase [Arcicella sp. DC25W]
MRKLATIYKKVLIFLILLFPLLHSNTSAQVIGNEWINPQQQYFKLKITQKGIHQISFEALLKSGFPENVHPEKIQIFRHGKEVAISVHHNNSTVFQANDFIAFYAENNDGSLDSLLYQPRNAQPHPYYSLFTDTASYFITYHIDNQKNKRISIQEKAPFQSLKPEEFHLEEDLQIFTSSFSEGQPEPIGSSLSTGILNSNYSFGKAWTGEIQKPNSQLHVDFQLKNFIKNSSSKPKIEILFSGRSEGKHHLQISLSNKLVDSLFFENHFTELYKKEVDFGMEKNKISILSSQSNDQFSVSFLKITYPQSFQMKGLNEKVFHFLPNSSTERLIIVQNPPKNAFVYDISDKSNPIKIDFKQSDSTLTFQTNGQRILVSNQIKKLDAIEQISFRELPKNKVDFLIITHQKLLQSAQEYANYRASEKGGKHDTLCVTTDFLYNYFTYGDKNPLAIQRFLAFMKNTEKSQFCFIIGTAIYPQKARKNSLDYQLDLVPTWGFPCGDIPFGMNLNDDQLNIPVGRLATNNPQIVLDYLEKVKEHEAQAMNELWRKKSLMMSGGRSVFELNTFKDYVTELKEISENGLLGQQVQLLAKKTDNPTEFINVTEQVNQGVGMITMFGHSASQQTDMDIGYVSNDLLGYKNQGKYPFILVNGCNAGDLFASQNSFGTDWINTPKRGSILFLAHSYLSYSFSLKSYSDELFQTLFQDSIYIDKAFGTIMQTSINRYLQRFPNSAFELANAQQFTLQGDPAIVLFPASKPDFAIDNTAILLPNQKENSAILPDSLSIGIVIKNLGRVYRNALNIQVKRTFPNGKTVLFENTFLKEISYQDTVYFKIPNDKFSSVGTNRFEVMVDYNNHISELQENNNTFVLEYNFPSQNISTLTPQNFSITNQKIVDFQIQTPFKIDNPNIIFEIDTNHLFLSVYKKSIILPYQNFLSFKHNILEKDSTVYYWRVKTESDNWIENSFLFLKNSSEGFAQFSFPQLSKSVTDERIYLENTQWKFHTSSITLSAKIYGTNSGVPRSHRANSVILNDKILISDGVCYPWFNLNAVAFNRALRPYAVIPSLVCGYAPYAVNYLSTEEYSNDLKDYFTAAESGNYVILWNSGHLEYQNWTNEFRKNFIEIGVDTNKIKRLTKGSPFLVIGRKGAKKALLELFPDVNKRGDTQILNLENYTIKDNFDTGKITSPLIGVASKWDEVLIDVEKNEQQTFSYDILGVNLKGEERILAENIQQKTFNISNIDAKEFPFLKIIIHLKNTDFSEKSPQLKSLIVHYQSPPEGILSEVENNKLTDKQEYENFKIQATFKNISNKDFSDSISVKQVITNTFLNKKEIKSFKVKALKSQDSVSVSLLIQTAGWLGENTFSLTFNSEILPEKSYQNNSIYYTFKVISDEINPILSVTFDGRKIQQYEIVSSKPFIKIGLKDENIFRIKKDTNDIDLKIKYCPTCAFKRVYFSQNDITWRTDSLTNTFLIDYFPQNLPKDTLTISVQAQDVTGNFAGNRPYQISFRILPKDTLMAFKVFPNPFQLFTKFVLVLSGESIPDEFYIEIFDLQGKQVALVRPDNSIKIGVNEIIWEGKDFTSNYLPSGTYFYRLILKNKAVDLALRTSGKLIISR